MNSKNWRFSNYGQQGFKYHKYMHKPSTLSTMHWESWDAYKHL